MSLFWGCLAARWSVSVGLLPTFRTLSRVPCGMLRWCCAGAIGHFSWQRPMVVAGMRWMERMGGPARGKWKKKKEKRKQKKEAKREESQRSLGGIKGQEWGIGNDVQSLGVHQLLSGGGSLCTLFFFILSRYSCWDTASTDARISSSSQSFRPKAEGDICWMRARHSRAG